MVHFIHCDQHARSRVCMCVCVCVCNHHRIRFFFTVNVYPHTHVLINRLTSSKTRRPHFDHFYYSYHHSTGNDTMKLFSFFALLVLALLQTAASFGPGCCCKICYLPGCNAFCMNEEVKQYMNVLETSHATVNATWLLSQDPEDALYFAEPLASE